MDRIAQNITNKDNLLIYFSGHGIEIGNEGYWVPSDARTKERSQLIPNSEIKNALSKTVCKHALIMVDACFSSTIFKSSQFSIKNDHDWSTITAVKNHKLLPRTGVRGKLAITL